MPEYTFLCDDKNNGCGRIFCVICSYAKYTDEQTCPDCKKKKSVRRYYELDLPGTQSVIRKGKNELTVGHLAHRNSEKMSSDEKTQLTYEHNKYKYEEPTQDLPKGMSRMGKPTDRKVSTKQKRRDSKKRKRKGD